VLGFRQKVKSGRSRVDDQEWTVKSGRSSVDKSKSILKYAKNKVIVAKPGLVIVKTGELFGGLEFFGLGSISDLDFKQTSQFQFGAAF